MTALETALTGLRRGQFTLDAAQRPLSMIAQTVENVMKTGTGAFSWRELVSDTPLIS